LASASADAFGDFALEAAEEVAVGDAPGPRKGRNVHPPALAPTDPHFVSVVFVQCSPWATDVTDSESIWREKQYNIGRVGNGVRKEGRVGTTVADQHGENLKSELCISCMLASREAWGVKAHTTSSSNPVFPSVARMEHEPMAQNI
jgi:hypothetical protein